MDKLFKIIMNGLQAIVALIAGFFILRKADTSPVANEPDSSTTTTQPPAIDYSRISSPLQFFDIRNDALGGGGFLDSRDGGSRTHDGVDIICAPGEQVTSPIDGVVVRRIRVYPDNPANPVDSTYVGVEIQGTGNDVDKDIEIFYMTSFAVGSSVRRGQAIGNCQDISQRRPNWIGVMQPHLHIELKLNGNLVDPSKFVQ